jgi:hypothetical protein
VIETELKSGRKAQQALGQTIVAMLLGSPEFQRQ